MATYLPSLKPSKSEEDLVSKDELISDVLPWTPSHRRTSVGRSARTYLQQLFTDTGCSREDLPNTHTHTHTHTYIYIYIYIICKRIFVGTILKRARLICLHRVKLLHVVLFSISNSIQHYLSIYLHTVNWFEVMLYYSNDLIQHSVVCTQLNSFKYNK